MCDQRNLKFKCNRKLYCCNCKIKPAGNNGSSGCSHVPANTPATITQYAPKVDAGDCCQCIKQIESSARFLENILDVAATIVQIMLISGIHQCKASKATDVIVYSFLHFDEFPDRMSGKYKRRIRKETLFNDLGRECQMNGLEAYLTYAIIKNVFKAFYHGQVMNRYEPGFIDDCKWRHAIKRTIEAYMKQNIGSDNCLEVENRIRCAFRKYLDNIRCRNDSKKSAAKCCCCCQASSKCPPAPSLRNNNPCCPLRCDVVCPLCHAKDSGSDISVADEKPQMKLCADPKAIEAKINCNMERSFIKICPAAMCKGGNGANIEMCTDCACRELRTRLGCKMAESPCTCQEINDRQRSCECQQGKAAKKTICCQSKDESNILLHIDCKDLFGIGGGPDQQQAGNSGKINLPCKLKSDCGEKKIEISIRPEMLKQAECGIKALMGGAASGICLKPLDPSCGPCKPTFTLECSCEELCGEDGLSENRPLSAKESKKLLESIASAKGSEREISGYDENARSRIKLVEESAKGGSGREISGYDENARSRASTNNKGERRSRARASEMARAGPEAGTKSSELPGESAPLLRGAERSRSQMPAENGRSFHALRTERSRSEVRPSTNNARGTGERATQPIFVMADRPPTNTASRTYIPALVKFSLVEKDSGAAMKVFFKEEADVPNLLDSLKVYKSEKIEDFVEYNVSQPAG